MYFRKLKLFLKSSQRAFQKEFKVAKHVFKLRFGLVNVFNAYLRLIIHVVWGRKVSLALNKKSQKF